MLSEHSTNAGRSDAGKALELAATAVSVAERLDRLFYPAALVEDARAESWLRLGDARRRASDLPGADEAISRANELLGSGTGDPLLQAQVLEAQAMLRRDQGRPAEARTLSNTAAKTSREAGGRADELPTPKLACSIAWTRPPDRDEK